MFLRKYWLPISVFIVAICAVGLYMLATQPPKEPIVIYKPVEPLPKSEVKAPVEQTPQGHFHDDGTFHAGPHETHAPAEVATPESQGAPFRAQIAPPVNAQLPEQANAPFVDHTEAGLPIPRQEFPARTQAYYDAFEKWKAWNDKQDELREEYLLLNRALTKVLPTKEEAIRFENDENYKRELGRKVTEAAQKIADVERKMREREANRPPLPYTP